MKNIKAARENIRQIRFDYVVETDETPSAVYSRVRERLERELYNGNDVSVDCRCDDTLTEACLEMQEQYPDMPRISETAVAAGGGSELPKIYAIAAAWPVRTLRTIKRM